MAKLGSFATARSSMQANLAQLWVRYVIYPIVQSMDGDIWALGPTWMFDTCCTQPSETAAVCMKLCFDPHCFVSAWHWRSSCEQQADLMLLYNAEWGSDRLHKPVIGSCSHRGLSTLSRLLVVWYSRPCPQGGNLSIFIIITFNNHILPPAQRALQHLATR